MFFDQRLASDPWYRVGLYLGGTMDQRFRLPARGSCEQVWPTALYARRSLWLYVAERDCPGRWNRVVLYRGPDALHLSRVATVAGERALYRPTIAFDGSRFLLWYTRDSGGWANELVLRESPDGVRFGAPQSKDRARSWYAAGFNPDVALREHGRWYVFANGYAAGLRSDSPGIYVLRSPTQSEYPGLRRLVAEKREAPKLDPSFFCRDGHSYAGVFTTYGGTGQLLGREWTVLYRAHSLLGPWTFERGYVPLGRMLSLENPSLIAREPDIPTCTGLLAAGTR